MPEGALTSFTVSDAFATLRVRHSYLIRFFYNLVVAYFLGHLV